MATEINVFEDPQYDEWRKKYWDNKSKIKEFDEFTDKTTSSVKTVIKKRDKEKESEDFHQAQLDISKDVLPPQTIGKMEKPTLFDQQYHRKEDFAAKDDKMEMTPQQAFDKVYPSGKQDPQSMALKPTKPFPTQERGSLMLDVKNNTAEWIGDHYLPKQCQDYKDKYTPPPTQLSSGEEEENKCNITIETKANFASTNIGELIEKILKEKYEN